MLISTRARNGMPASIKVANGSHLFPHLSTCPGIDGVLGIIPCLTKDTDPDNPANMTHKTTLYFFTKDEEYIESYDSFALGGYRHVLLNVFDKTKPIYILVHGWTDSFYSGSWTEVSS